MNKGNSQESKLKPILGLLDATAINVGAIVGAGIFIVTGIAAGVAGSAMIFSILLVQLLHYSLHLVSLN